MLASRASFLTGQPPQVTGVIDQMQFSFVRSLDPEMPNMGSVLKAMGYKTAYFGKFEMDKTSSIPSPASTTATSLNPTASIYSAQAEISAVRPIAATKTTSSSRARASVFCARPRPPKRKSPGSHSSWSRASSIPTTSCTVTVTYPASLRCRNRSCPSRYHPRRRTRSMKGVVVHAAREP